MDDCRRRGLLSATPSIVACLALMAAAGERGAKADDEAEIRRRGQDYLQAVEHGNEREIAGFWTAHGDYIDETGRVIAGRELAAKSRVAEPREQEQMPLSAKAVSLRFVGPDVAIEDGTVCLAETPKGQTEVKRYTAIWVRQKGTWFLDAVRELPLPAETIRDRLRELEWMIGDWASDDGGQTLRLSCTWSKDKHFLLREIDVNLPGHEPLHVSQRIGWDAREKQIKSWAFDSEGGHGSGLWFYKDGRWIVEAESIAANGSRSTGTNICSRDENDGFTWQATNAETDGQPVPDRTLRLVRQKASDQ